MSETIVYRDRVGSGCNKWDRQSDSFGEEGLLGMWVADMDFKTADCVVEKLREHVDFGVFGYADPPQSYYDAFIKWEKEEHGWDVRQEWIRFSPGVVSGFHWLIRLLTKPEDGVLVLTPVYYPFFHAVEMADCHLVASELVRDEAGRYSIDYSDFERKIETGGVKVFLLCSPHNPAGRVWTREELERMLAICKQHGVYVISDEIHQDFTFAGHTHIPTATLKGGDAGVATLCAASKTFNLAGLCNSFVILPDERLRKKYDKLLDRIRIARGCTMGYLAAEAAFTGGKPWLSAVKEIIYGNYLYASRQLTETFPALTVSPLEGTYLMWADFRAYIKPEEMADFFQKECRLAVDYGSWFGGDWGSCARFNLATSRETVERAIHAVTAALQKRIG